MVFGGQRQSMKAIRESPAMKCLAQGLRSMPCSEPLPSTNSGSGYSAPARRFTGAEHRMLRSSVSVLVLTSRDFAKKRAARSEMIAPASHVSATCSRPTIDESHASCLISGVWGPYSYRTCGLSGNDTGGKLSVQRSQALGQPSLFTTVKALLPFPDNPYDALG